jgi:hypothetical protein
MANIYSLQPTMGYVNRSGPAHYNGPYNFVLLLKPGLNGDSF